MEGSVKRISYPARSTLVITANCLSETLLSGGREVDR